MLPEITSPSLGAVPSGQGVSALSPQPLETWTALHRVHVPTHAGWVMFPGLITCILTRSPRPRRLNSSSSIITKPKNFRFKPTRRHSQKRREKLNTIQRPVTTVTWTPAPRSHPPIPVRSSIPGFNIPCHLPSDDRNLGTLLSSCLFFVLFLLSWPFPFLFSFSSTLSNLMMDCDLSNSVF